MQKRLLLAALLFSPALKAAAPAPCVAARVLPSATVIPLNVPGFGFTGNEAGTGQIQFKNLTTATNVPITTAKDSGFVKITPTQPLAIGTSYEIEFPPLCGNSATKYEPVRFTAAASAPLPTSVGTVQGTPTVETKDFGTTRYTIGATYTLAADMLPWANVYALTATVDGNLTTTKPTINGSILSMSIVGWCNAANAATQNHELKVVANLPFAPKLETAGTSLTFNCPAPSIKTPTGVVTGGTATPQPVTPTTPTGGGDGGSSAAAPASSGGGCSSSSSSRSSALMFFPALALLAIRRARKRND